MKKNILLFAAIAIVGTATLTLNSLQAQDAPAPGSPPVGQAPPFGQAPPPGSRPGLPARFRSRPMGNSYQRTTFFLKQAKADLERSSQDYDGHRQSAIDACDKAIHELDAVQASVQASARAAAEAAAAAASATNPPPQQAPTPAPVPATNQ